MNAIDKDLDSKYDTVILFIIFVALTLRLFLIVIC
jgi:hypothetical protein